MADNDNTSTRLWSEEVAIAAASDPLTADTDPTKEPGYEFSNGAQFDSGKGAASNDTNPA